MVRVMIVELGHFTLALALMIAIVQAFVPLVGCNVDPRCDALPIAGDE